MPSRALPVRFLECAACRISVDQSSMLIKCALKKEARERAQCAWAPSEQDPTWSDDESHVSNRGPVQMQA